MWAYVLFLCTNQRIVVPSIGKEKVDFEAKWQAWLVVVFMEGQSLPF